MNYVVITDLDETLVDDTRDISDYTEAVINRLLEAQIHIVPCTARSVSELPKRLLKTNIRYYVCTNGSIIYDAKEDKVVKSFLLDKETGLSILDRIDIEKLFINIIKDGVVHTEERFFDFFEETGYIPLEDLNNMRASRVVIESGYKLLESLEEIDKLHMNFKTEEDKNDTVYKIGESNKVLLQSSHPLNLEITNSDCDKGRSALYVIKLLGQEDKKVIAFGDNYNDIPMFKVADVKVKMLNGVKELYKHTNFETAVTNSEDGVAKFLEKYIFKENNYE